MSVPDLPDLWARAARVAIGFRGPFRFAPAQGPKTTKPVWGQTGGNAIGRTRQSRIIRAAADHPHVSPKSRTEKPGSGILLSELKIQTHGPPVELPRSLRIIRGCSPRNPVLLSRPVRPTHCPGVQPSFRFGSGPASAASTVESMGRGGWIVKRGTGYWNERGPECGYRSVTIGYYLANRNERAI